MSLGNELPDTDISNQRLQKPQETYLASEADILSSLPLAPFHLITHKITINNS